MEAVNPEPRNTWQIKDLTPEQDTAVKAACALLEPHFPVVNLVVSDGKVVQPNTNFFGPVVIMEGTKFRAMPIYYASVKLGELLIDQEKINAQN